MRIIFEGIKKGIFIFWDDAILLIIFNFICFLALLPALLFYTITAVDRSLITAIINTLLILPTVFFIFALYYVLFDCRYSIVISFKTFFGYLRSSWKQALFFGVLNLFFALLVSWNLRFYAQFEADWATVIQMMFLSISLIWAILQMVMLPLYPRLDDPTFKLVLKNAAAIFGGYPLPVLILLSWTVLFLAATLFFQFLGVFFTFVVIAAFAEGIVGQIVLDVKGDLPE